MFNNSNHSSERSIRQSQRREFRHNQRPPSTQNQRPSTAQKSRSASRSAHSSPSPRRSETKPKWKIPEWVHCEKCFITYERNSNIILLACGHIFCKTCLRVDNSILPDQPIPCLRCKTAVAHRILDESLDSKLHGMFQESWTDPILQINLKHLQFMMTKSQNFMKYLSKSFKQKQTKPPEWQERYNIVKKMNERKQNLKKFHMELTAKLEQMKTEGAKRYKNIQLYRSYYARKKQLESRSATRQQSQHTVQGNYQKNMKFISSGRNEHTNPYIGQLKSANQNVNSNRQWSTNQNQSGSSIRPTDQRIAPQSWQRPDLSLNHHRQDPPKLSSQTDSRRSSSLQTATFRPKTREFKVDSHRFEASSHSQKRLAPSYHYDEYTTPSKRPAQYSIRRDSNMNASNASSGGLSLDLNNSGYNPHAKSIELTKYNNRHDNSFRMPTFQ